jgi:hypothetical protein
MSFAIVSGMEPSARHHLCEAQMLELLTGRGLAEPDEVTYEPNSVILRWQGPKLAVIVDLDPVPGVVYDQPATPSPPTGSASGTPSAAMRERAASSASRRRS